MRDMIEELIGYLANFENCAHELSVLRKMLKKFNSSPNKVKSNDLECRAEYVIVCEVAFALFKRTGGLPGGVVARMLLGDQNYWTRAYAEHSKGIVDIHI